MCHYIAVGQKNISFLQDNMCHDIAVGQKNISFLQDNLCPNIAVGQTQFSFVQVSNTMVEEHNNASNAYVQLKYCLMGKVTSDSDIPLHSFLIASSQSSSAILRLESLNNESMLSFCNDVDSEIIDSSYCLLKQIHLTTS